MIRTLVFVGADSRLPWLRLAADGTVSQGAAITSLVALDPAVTAETIAIVPGDAVVLHWTELPGLAPAQAQAAARLLAADVSATPLDATHVAIGPADADGWRVLALVDSAAMADWLTQLAEAGIDPDRMLPAPLLLAEPEAGVTVLDGGGNWQVRGHRLAFAAEPDLALMMIGAEPVGRIDLAGWQAELGGSLGVPQLDLRQAGFARARRWRIDRQRVRRLAIAGLAVIGLLVAAQVAAILRFGFAADRAEMQLADAARSVLPRGTIITDPRGQVAARSAQLGSGTGFSALAAALFAVLRDRPALALHGLSYASETGLVASMTAPALTDRDAILTALDAAGLAARFGAVGEAAGTPTVEITVRPR